MLPRVLTLKLTFLSMQGRPGPPGLQGSKGEKGSQVNNEHEPVEIYKAGCYIVAWIGILFASGKFMHRLFIIHLQTGL